MTSPLRLGALALVTEFFSLLALKAAYERARFDYKEARRG